MLGPMEPHRSARRLSPVLLAAAALALGAAPPAGAAERTCGELARFVEGTAALVTVKADRVRCRTARRVLARPGQAAQRGWTCNSAGTEQVCTKGRKRASHIGARRTRDCGRVGFEPDSDNLASSITAKRVRCRTARRVARGARDSGPTDPEPYSARGFRCAGEALDTPLPSALFLCRRDRASVAFIRT